MAVKTWMTTNKEQKEERKEKRMERGATACCKVKKNCRKLLLISPSALHLFQRFVARPEAIAERTSGRSRTLTNATDHDGVGVCNGDQQQQQQNQHHAQTQRQATHTTLALPLSMEQLF